MYYGNFAQNSYVFKIQKPTKTHHNDFVESTKIVHSLRQIAVYSPNSVYLFLL